MLNFVAKLAISLAMSAANTALTMSRRIEGPRLDSLKFTSGDYGAALPLVWGKRRLEAPIFWAEDLKEVKQTRKTKGGKYNDYTYYGTWAVALADHEVASVTRIWLDTHLAYDITGAGPVTAFDFGSSASGGKGGGSAGTGGFSINDHMSLYYGTEDQEPDPRIQATTDAKVGTEGSTPAYRGVAYLVFKDLPLEKLGNRIPQVSVEVVTAATGHIPSENYTPLYNPNTAFNLKFSPDFKRVSWMNGSGGVEIWDTAARTPMLEFDSGVPIFNDATFGVYNDGSILCVGFIGDLVKITPEGVVSTVLVLGGSQTGCTVIEDGVGVEHYGTYPFSFGGTWYYDGVAYSPGWQACMYQPDAHGNIWVAGRVPAPGSTTSTCYFMRLTTVDNSPGYLPEFTVTGLTAEGPSSGGEQVYFAFSGDNIILRWGTHNYLIDPTTGAILDTVSASAEGVIYSRREAWQNLAPGSKTIWLGNSEYDLLTGALVRTVTGAPANSGQYQSVYDPINHALWTNQSGITIYYLDRVTGDGVTLGSIAADVADLCRVNDYTFTGLDQTVIGWSATQGQASNMLEPLFDAFDSDVSPHDFTIHGVKRSGVSTGTLSTAWFAKDQGERYSLTVRQASELPKAVVYNFADTTADQQPHNIRSSRPLDATDASAETSIDLTTFASDPTTMRGLADRHFRRLWNSRKEASFGLTFQQLGIEPTDVQTPTFDDETFVSRCVKTVIRANGVMATEWVYDDPSLALTDGAASASFDGRDESKIIVAGIAKGFVLDIPLVRDADSSANPLVYIGAAPFSDNSAFPGATIYEAIDGDYTEDIGSIPSTQRTVWGYTTGALGDANPNLWDRGNSVNVKIQSGSLTGCTETDIELNPLRNQALLGDEILNFTTATLQVDGSYTLSGFKRGRRGTEWACATHTARDVFLLLADTETFEEGLSEVNTNLSFKAVAEGRTADGAFVNELTPFTGASLKPYAPCHLSASQNASTGAWALSWVRRTRVGGDWTGGGSIPLSEASEEYEVDILDYDGTTVVQSYTGLTSPAVTYAAADQVADYGITRGAFDYRVYQISDAVGRGFVANGTASGTEAVGLAHSTQWRLRFPQGSIGWTETNIWEVEMRGRYGSADQCAGGTADASTEYDGSHTAAKAFDNVGFTGQGWAPSTGNATSWLRYTFASPVYVAQLAVASSGSPAPKQIVLEYWDGAAWQTKLDTGTIGSWGTNETKTYNIT